MKVKVLLAAVLGVLGFVSPASADPVLLINGGGVLTGARNVRVAGAFYDVTFVDGTCVDVFAGCDAVSDFQFATFEGARAAADALLRQVFVDAPPRGNFDTHPELTFGCTDPVFCVAAIPTGLTTNGGVVSGALAFNAAAANVLTNFNFLTDYDTTVDTEAVWATFTAVQPVPEPASLMLLGSGLAIVRLRRCRARHSPRRPQGTHSGSSSS